MGVYLDTSALAKCYVREPGSDEFEAWVQEAPEPTISSLTLVEMRCLLARRRRAGSLDAQSESRVYALFLQDIDQCHLSVEAVGDGDVRSAVHLMGRVDAQPLRALDAIHLSICASPPHRHARDRRRPHGSSSLRARHRGRALRLSGDRRR